MPMSLDQEYTHPFNFDHKKDDPMMVPTIFIPHSWDEVLVHLRAGHTAVVAVSHDMHVGDYVYLTDDQSDAAELLAAQSFAEPLQAVETMRLLGDQLTIRIYG